MNRKKELARFLIVGGLVGVFASLIQVFFGIVGTLICIGLVLLAIATAVIWQNPYWVILFLVIFMPVETFVLKFVPGPDQIYLAFQFLSEILIYLTFALVLVKRFLLKGSIRKTFVDVPLIIFIAGAVISITINRAPLIASLMNIRSVIRYLALFYLVVNLDLSPRQVSRLIKAILVMGVLEILVGALQLVGGGSVNSFFAPRPSALEVFGTSRTFVLISRGRELGSIFGTLGDTLYFGLFLLIPLAVYLGRTTKITFQYLCVITVIVLAIGLSYSRASLLGALIMLFIWYVRFHKVRTTQVLTTGGLLLIAVAAMAISNVFGGSEGFFNPRLKQQNIIKNVTSVFSEEYVTMAQSNRLGMLMWVPPVVLQNAPLFGYGPDQATTIDQLNRTDIPGNYKVIKESGFEDVYWVAILAYYGVVGVAVFIAIFLGGIISAWNIYREARTSLTREVAAAVFCTWLSAPFLLFFYRALEFRVYAFFLWLIPALMLNLSAHEGKSMAKERSNPRSQIGNS